ncbi:pyruvate dehydrogenase (acetyl-transferring) E1 component subunit alpha [Candidatus Woesearchaeota archaeon]|nr:pyruvate dehydrogenase (acetyl-transferring) E1 component subunit alpha [Candidatus Woesearchaeota archaeon]
MPRTILQQFAVEFLEILDELGNADATLVPTLSDELILRIYKTMVLARVFDAKLLALQRQGRIGTVASAKGQEASQIPVMACLTKDDWVIPSFREHPAAIYRGLPLRNILLYSAGDERGSMVEGEQHDLPVSIPVGSQPLHAVGIAWGMKLKQQRTVAVTFLGDGATSEGEVHEAMNFAGRFQVPCIFICQNNQYAISTPLSKQTAAQTLAQKAIAYGFNGIRVDGNDVFAVYTAVHDAVENARMGKGPSFIECLTYRLQDHTTSDDAKKYRNPEEVKIWEKKDPIERLRKWLQATKKWNDEQERKLQFDIEQQIAAEIEAFEKIPLPTPADMFSFMYATLPPIVKEQRETFEKK